jgi:hypothetical protein
MIGCYDFCGHYEWTFEWLRAQGGEPLVREYWDAAIARDSQTPVAALFAKGIAGMKEYWRHSLEQEMAGYEITATEAVFRIDMHACPSKGFLIHNGLVQYHDYCDHCMGWIGPMMKDAGFVIDHAHNHHGQCWWEMRRAEDATPPSGPGELSGASDVRLRADWPGAEAPDIFERSNHPDDKSPNP